MNFEVHAARHAKGGETRPGMRPGLLRGFECFRDSNGPLQPPQRLHKPSACPVGDRMRRTLSGRGPSQELPANIVSSGKTPGDSLSLQSRKWVKISRAIAILAIVVTHCRSSSADASLSRQGSKPLFKARAQRPKVSSRQTVYGTVNLIWFSNRG